MKVLKFLILSFATVSLASCIPPHALYLRNFLSSELDIQLVFENRHHFEEWEEYNYKLAMRKDVTSFSRTGRRLFRDTIIPEQKEPFILEYRIPPRSVTQFGNSWSFAYVKAIIRGMDYDKKIIPAERIIVDNITSRQEPLEFGYKWLGNYFLDIK